MTSTRQRFIDVPKEVMIIAKRLNAADERLYVVGGALRDILAQKTALDFDLATTATPQTMLKLFPQVIPTGIAHGTVTIILNKKRFETTTLRGDSAYSDGRHPDQIRFLTDIEADLARRDFTINAMAWEPLEESFFDPFDGEGDLKRRILRAVGDPKERFEEDGLRALRAARFAATLEFALDPQTFSALSSAKDTLLHVSAERKRDEIAKLLDAPTPSLGLEILKRASLFSSISPELDALAKAGLSNDGTLSFWQRTLKRIDGLPRQLHLRLAGFLLNADLREKTCVNEAELADTARRVLKQLCFSSKIIENAVYLVRSFRLVEACDWNDEAVRRLAARAGRAFAMDLIELKRADVASRQPLLGEEIAVLKDLGERVKIVLATGVPLSIADLKVNGTDLSNELGLPPGPRIGELLKLLLEHVIQNPDENTRERLFARAKAVV